MSWANKEKANAWDRIPAEGLWYLDGDIAEVKYSQDRLRHQYYSLIQFPSGIQRECTTNADTNALLIHLSSDLYVPYWGNALSAKQSVSQFLQQQERNLILTTPHESILTVIHPVTGRGYRLQYNTDQKYLENISVAPRHTMDLLDGEMRALLPPLYANEDKGLEAQALVKFFTPDGGWVWYASEFNGDDFFFGLVSGLEVDLGYFSLSELTSVKGVLGLPVERDLFYEPQTLQKLQHLHR